ncbi:hypothetical protein [Rhodanobacter sp. L36]|uniref:tetratricopeptide repeat protein n=1 Tax=Rhodanobacter sp. L36 TaxID=1747221 RepID=UPI00131E1A61|nr:hypothetical protein [Rhodanobacter sp. L36]
MTTLWQRLKQRKMVQWTLAYVAAAFALLQGVDIVAQRFGWPDAIERILIIVICIGFVITLLLAWYHGEQARQRVTGTELVIIALVLGFGAVLLWRVAGTSSKATMASGSSATPDIVAASSAAVVNSIPAKSIAVLPFENLSEDKGNQYFADGMQDLILTRLADIGELKVISRTSTMKYASHPDDLKIIAQQLGVAAILEGSVQKAGNSVLINVQLIDARTDNHLWAESYQRTLENIFGVEGEVAGKIASALKATLSPSQAEAVIAVPTRNPKAYDAYLWAKHTQDTDNNHEDASPEAIAGFQQAVALDPQFALAWADLAWAQLWAWRDETQPTTFGQSATLQAAQQNAQRALTLQPDLPEAHLAMSVIDLYGVFDVDGARTHAQRALDLRPNDAYAYRLLADVDQNQGDFVSGATQMERALTLKPNDAVLSRLVALAHAANGDYAGAREAVRRALAIKPDDLTTYALMSSIELWDSGNAATALGVLESIPLNVPNRATIDARRVPLLLMQRDYATARTLVAGMHGGNDAEKIAITRLQADVEYAAGGVEKARPYLLMLDAWSRRSMGNPELSGKADFHSDWALVLARLGRSDDALQQMDAAMKLLPRAAVKSRSLYRGAVVQLTLGQQDAALATLQKVFATPGHGIVISQAVLKTDPLWDPLRQDPRFQQLLVADTNGG